MHVHVYVIIAPICGAHVQKGQAPKDVDYEGQLVQFDAAKKSGVVKHIVLVSSMGGTKPDHFLNQSMDKMVMWKRLAQKDLVEKYSDLPSTIIHPGGLLPHVAGGSKESCKGGERTLVVDLDDAMVEREYRLIPREDVAEVCVLSLKSPEARNRSFDIVSDKAGEGTAFDGDLKSLLATLPEGKNADYAIPAELKDLK